MITFLAIFLAGAFTAAIIFVGFPYAHDVADRRRRSRHAKLVVSDLSIARLAAKHRESTSGKRQKIGTVRS